MNEWKPIETAPKDLEQPVLTCRHGGLMAVAQRIYRYDYAPPKLVWCCTDGVELLNVTHWQPLPSPPNSEGTT